MLCKECNQDKRIAAMGLCSACYGKMHDKEKSAICVGCQEFKPIKSKGLCNKCYMRVQRHGDTSWERKKKGDKLCSYCHEKPVHAKDLCKTCYARYLSNGVPEKVKVKKRKECLLCHKIKTIKARGYCKRCHSNYLKITKFGITVDDYKKMHKDQHGVCMICGEVETSALNGIVKRLSIDHCHTTGKVRGLLCARCNTALGGFKDSIDILTKALDYLK